VVGFGRSRNRLGRMICRTSVQILSRPEGENCFYIPGNLGGVVYGLGMISALWTDCTI
jgi:hypothetical protein